MVKINKTLKDIPAMLYDPNGIYLGDIETELELMDVRLQVNSKKLKGYTIHFEEFKFDVLDLNKVYFNLPKHFFNLNRTYQQRLDEEITVDYEDPDYSNRDECFTLNRRRARPRRLPLVEVPVPAVPLEEDPPQIIRFREPINQIQVNLEIDNNDA